MTIETVDAGVGTRECIEGRTVLLVEDDEDVVDMFSYALGNAGCSVVARGTVEEALEILGTAGKRFDALILDLGLPDGDGREVCGWLRRNQIALPVLVCTGSDGSMENVVTGIEAGACDYFGKPCHEDVIVAKVRAAIGSYRRSHRKPIEIGNWEFRTAERTLYDPAASKRVRLTTRESALLQILYQNDGHTVPRQTLLEQVWGYKPSVRTHTIESHVYRLRRKIEEDPANAVLLVSSDGGYRLGKPGHAEDFRMAS